MNIKVYKKINFGKKWLLLAALPLTAAVWKLTDEYSSGYYHRPLSLSTELAANFGEVRENHFHMGLDIRTNGRENLPVYAAADGYVSRISVEEAGYGNAMYITHPNGTTTVYAHLNHFMTGVENYVHDKQYQNECWQQNISFPPGKFNVTKGERIALSGNTGTSEGPHLHFEIRDTRTGNNINPLMNGITLADYVAPVINGLYWYNKAGSIYRANANKIELTANEGQYTTVQKVVTVNTPYISFGITATDKNTQSKYHLGIYKAIMYLDDSLKFSFALNGFNSSDTRYVNACIDYSSYIRSSNCIQLLSILPGNHLPVFEGSPSNGTIYLKDKKIHAVKILVSDAAGNTCTLVASVQYNGTAQRATNAAKPAGVVLPGKAVNITAGDAIIRFTQKAVYDTLPLFIKEENTGERNAASPAVFIHDASVPVHDSFLIKIKTTLAAGSPFARILLCC